MKRAFDPSPLSALTAPTLLALGLLAGPSAAAGASAAGPEPGAPRWVHDTGG